MEPAEADQKGLYSYIVKTTMLWACEQYAPDHPVWRDLENSEQMLLWKLTEALHSGSLPHFFIPEINLIAQTGRDVRQKCINIIKTLQKNVFMAAPFDIDEKLDFVRWVHSTVEKCRSVLSPRPDSGIGVAELLSRLLENPKEISYDGIFDYTFYKMRTEVRAEKNLGLDLVLD